jgi:imidazole glycerol-phosphate synthase subunit HisH
MITIVDYKMGNLGSIANMLKRSGFAATISSEVAAIDAAEKLILPGVGAWDHGMQHLAELGLIEPLRRRVLDQGVPLLGICLGMELLFERSEEGERPGLGWVRGACVRFRFDEREARLKVPHMGWNVVRPTRTTDLFADMADDAAYYFVHSYHVVCDDPADALGHTSHGLEFASAIGRGNVYGTQFHPEKSHTHGMRLLKNFAGLGR